jgi:amino acid transporter
MPSDPLHRDDAAELKALGYRQELLRDLGGFQNFALSFSVISILTGAVTLYGHGLTWGGPLVMTVGWPLVAGCTLLIALSLAELASAFPTAGALYHWASLLGGAAPAGPPPGSTPWASSPSPPPSTSGWPTSWCRCWGSPTPGAPAWPSSPGCW